MIRHLTDVEQLAAADGSLAPDRLAHTATCEACRQAVDVARSFLGQIAAADVPEPSPLFWNHFSARVKQATLAGGDDARKAPSWRGWVSLVATAATIVFAAWLVRQPGPTGDGLIGNRAPVTVSDAAPADGSGEVAWEAVLATTTDWEDDDLFALADQDAMSFDDLTSAEQNAFVRLLRQEMGVVQ